MSAVSPSPAPPSQTPASNSTQPPSSSTTPPAQQPSANTTQPPSSTTSPPPQQPSSPAPNSSVSPPPATSPPPPTRLAPPPAVPLAPPQSQLAPPPTVPSVPPPSQLAPPPSQSPPLSPPVASPPTSPSRPPPPPPTSPARRSPPPPQSSVPPRSSPPLSSPPPSAPPPSDPAPPLPSPPQENPPPPAAVPPPRNSTSTPPKASPPVSVSPPPPPRNSTSTPPRASPPVAVSPPPPPPRNSTSTPPLASPPVAVSPPPSSPPPSSLTPPPTNSPPSPTIPSSQPVPPSNSTPSLQLPPPPLPRSLLSPPPPSQNGSENSSPGSNSSGGIGTGAIVAIAVCGGILLLGFIGIALWCLNRHKKRNPPNDGYIMPLTLPSSTESDSSSLKKLSSAPLIKNNSGSDVVYTPSNTSGLSHSRNWFSYEELIKATNGFSSQNILGEGGFGFVYKGCLPDGREVAVKQLKIGGGQGEKEFKAEVDIISRVHHRHLVSLVGYCIEDNKRLLVYDYVPNNTLHFHLHGEDRPVLEWANRVKIAAGAAGGIAYLHEDCNPRIIHRDIKPSNILLDYSYEAMVADFGLAKLALDANSHITTRVMGTFGYVAPEYASSGKLTEKSDVYSYGVVLLELITGRKPIDESQSSEDESLVEWARPLLSHAIETNEFESLVDPKLEKNYVESEMLCMIQVAASCVRHSASKRPRMGQVVRAFDSLAASDLMNGMRVGESQALNSAQQAENRWFRRAAFGSFSTDFFSEESLHT